MSSMSFNCRIFWLALAVVARAAVADGTGGVNAPDAGDRPYLVLVSMDGFRWDYQARYETPALDRLAARGVRADALVPVFPTLTFPNHYSIATGLYPANHGLVGNRFFDTGRDAFYSLSDRNAVGDGRWYGGEPIWVTAERNGLVAAAYYFVGTEAAIGGVRPSHWYPFNPATPGQERVDQVLAWLALPEPSRPHLVTLYFEDVDAATHDHGVGSELSVEAIGRVDGYLGALLDGIEALPIADKTYVVVVSDHGMIDYRTRFEPFVLADVIDLEGVRSVDHGSIVFLYLDEPGRARELASRINGRWRRGQAVLPGRAPDGWHIEPGSRFADLIAVADPGHAVQSRRGPRPSSRGDHGWAPEARDMHGIFVAAGPLLPNDRRIGRVSAVDVHPLLAEILGLSAPGPIDGDPDVLVPLLER